MSDKTTPPYTSRQWAAIHAAAMAIRDPAYHCAPLVRVEGINLDAIVLAALEAADREECKSATTKEKEY